MAPGDIGPDRGNHFQYASCQHQHRDDDATAGDQQVLIAPQPGQHTILV